MHHCSEDRSRTRCWKLSTENFSIWLLSWEFVIRNQKSFPVPRKFRHICPCVSFDSHHHMCPLVGGQVRDKSLYLSPLSLSFYNSSSIISCQTVFPLTWSFHWICCSFGLFPFSLHSSSWLVILLHPFFWHHLILVSSSSLYGLFNFKIFLISVFLVFHNILLKNFISVIFCFALFL